MVGMIFVVDSVFFFDVGGDVRIVVCFCIGFNIFIILFCFCFVLF